MNGYYVNSTTFLVSGDKTSEFVLGRRVKIDCGIDGTFYSTVVSSIYSEPSTEVVIEDSVVTSNVTTVLYGVVSPGTIGSLPDHSHNNEPGSGGEISVASSLIDLTDTPSSYTDGKYLMSTTSGTVWVTISGTDSYEETDPVFTSSPAATITTSGIVSWNEAYSWGDHSTVGYITEVPTQSGTTISSFLDLSDTPSTYSGTANLYLQSTGSGTQWAEVQSSSVGRFLDLSDTPTTYSGVEGQYLRATASGIEFVSLDDLSLSVSGTTIGKQWFSNVEDIPANQPVYFLNETTGSISNFTYQSTGWLSDWTYRKKITIDNSNIGEDLTHFPLPIVLSSGTGQSNQDLTDIFDELGSSYQKIAVTKADGTTQLYVEVEQWDNGIEKALLWASKDDFTVTSGTTTDLYLYYDSNKDNNIFYVGQAGDVVAQNVWNSDFAAVYTMAQDPSGGAGCIKDSTSNGRDLTPYGAMGASNLVECNMGYGLSFNGSSQFLQRDSIPSLTDVSIRTWALFNDNGQDKTICGQYDNAASSGFLLFCTGTGVIRIDGRSSSTYKISASSGVYESTTEYHLAYGQKESGVDWSINIDGGVDVASSADTSTGTLSNNTYFNVGCYRLGTGSPIGFMLGVISNVMVSIITRPAAWIAADYHAQTDNLLTFSETEFLSIVETQLGTIKPALTDLTDTPSTYSGTENMYLQSTGSGTQWAEVQSSSVGSFLDLSDTPSTYSGIDGNYLRVTTSGIEAVDGIILKAPNETEWLLQVTNSGTLYTTSA